MDMTLSTQGERLVRSAHESWRSLVSGGCNLIIEYVTGNEWSISDLFRTFKDFDGTLVLIDLRCPLGEMTTSAKNHRQSGKLYLPEGFTLSSFKVSRNLPSTPPKFTRMQIEVPFGMEAVELNEMITAKLRQSGVI